MGRKRGALRVTRASTMMTVNPVAHQQMSVQCPPTSAAGDMIQVNVNGQMMTVQVRSPSLLLPRK